VSDLVGQDASERDADLALEQQRFAATPPLDQ
jgi:hypothetical protein